MNDWWKAPVLQGPENDYGEHDYLVEELPENYGKWIRHSRCDSCGKKRFLVFRSVYHFYCWDGWDSTENSECWKCMIKNKLWSIKYKFKKKINKKIHVVKTTFKLYTMLPKTKRDIKKCYNLALKACKGD